MLAGQLALARALDLKNAEGVGGSNIGEGCFVVFGDRVQVEGFAFHALEFANRVGHRALHANTQDVELEHSHRIHVVFIELTHR